MRALNEEQLDELASVLAVAAFLAEEDNVKALNQEGVDLHLEGAALLPYIPKDGEKLDSRPIFLTDAGVGWKYSLAGRKILYCGRVCWLLEVEPFDMKDTLQGLHKIAAARQIMLRFSSRTDPLETDQDIYEFILDSCGKAVEHPELCTLMAVEGDQTRIAAVRGFPDSVYNMTIPVKDTFLALATGGKLDRVASMDDLGKYRSRYLAKARTPGGSCLQASLSAPIYVNQKLYAILNFDSVNKDAFTVWDEELLDLVKFNIELILENHAMRTETAGLRRALQNTSCAKDCGLCRG